MSALAEELRLYAGTATGYRWGPQGRRVLADLFAACPSLKALVESVGVDPDDLEPLARRCQRWTGDDDRRLSEMYWAGAGPREMARALRRSDGAVRCRLAALGLHLRDRRGGGRP